MSQHDFNIANQGFPATRADINNAFQAIASNSSGATAPSTTYANMWWYDTTNNKMYLRNEADSAWIEVATIDQTNNEWQITTGQISAVDGDGIAFKTDDGTTRVTLDDSGNLLVGKTSTSSTTAGGNIFGGLGSFVRDGNTPLSLNRRTNDGEIISFAAQDSVVGSIAGYGGQLIIGTSNTGLRFQNSIPAVIPRTISDGASDGVFNLGDSNARFQHLYLSGGVYLGGTGSANHLDDYEEGTFTPFLDSGGTSVGYEASNCVYVKIGKFVHCQFEIFDVVSPTSDPFEVAGFPFTNETESMGSAMYQNVAIGSGKSQLMPYMGSNKTEIRFYSMGNSTTWSARTGNDLGTSFDIIGAIQYRTSS